MASHFIQTGRYFLGMAFFLISSDGLQPLDSSHGFHSPSSMILSEVFGSAAALLSTGAFIPQVLKTWQSKKAEDVSYVLLVAFCSGCFCWIIYGYMTKAYAVLIANSITFTLNLLILAMKFVFERTIREETL